MRRTKRANVVPRQETYIAKLPTHSYLRNNGTSLNHLVQTSSQTTILEVLPSIWNSFQKNTNLESHSVGKSPEVKSFLTLTAVRLLPRSSAREFHTRKARSKKRTMAERKAKSLGHVLMTKTEMSRPFLWSNAHSCQNRKTKTCQWNVISLIKLQLCSLILYFSNVSSPVEKVVTLYYFGPIYTYFCFHFFSYKYPKGGKVRWNFIFNVEVHLKPRNPRFNLVKSRFSQFPA